WRSAATARPAFLRPASSRGSPARSGSRRSTPRRPATSSAASTAPASRGARRCGSTPRRRQRERDPGLALDQEDEIREVPLAEPGADRGDEHLRDLGGDGHRHAALARDVEQEARVLRGERERELRRPPPLVEALDHAIDEEVARAARPDD